MLILAGLAYYIYVSPVYDSISGIRSDLSYRKNVLQKAKNLATQRDEMLASYNSISEGDIEKLGKIIPAKFSSVELANNISAVALKSGLTIKQVKITSETPSSNGGEVILSEEVKPYKTYTISFSTSGQYSQFSQFLKDLESNIYLNDLDSMTVGPSSDDKANKLDFGLVLKVYSLQ